MNSNANARNHDDGFIHIGAALDRFIERIMNPEAEPLHDPTIERMVEVEPSVGHLIDHASRRFACGYYGWCQGAPLYKWLESTVGWHAANPLLRSSECYDIVQTAVLMVFRTGLCDRCECEEQYPEDPERQEACMHGAWE